MSTTTSNRFSRVLSIRDKKRTPSRSRLQPDDFPGLFTLDEKARKSTKDEEKKVQEVLQRLAAIGLANTPETRAEYALRAKSTDGDVDRAVRLLVLLDESIKGVLKPYNPSVKLVGSENREKVTCYLDSLLFAMFAKPDVFEAILFHHFDDEAHRKLVTIIRLFVNMLRTGRLITVDIMQQLQESLAECGWKEAAKIKQQDASEAFTFITDQLQLPLLTLKTDLYHSGKEDATDDHKFITERMLEVAIPDDVPKEQTITLELCLEEYFNNRVEVKRLLARRNTAASTRSVGSTDKFGFNIETKELASGASSPAIAETPVDEQPTERPVQLQRTRGLSIFSERRVSVEGVSAEDGIEKPADQETRQRANSVRKEVSMPAWQFINLIPWYTDNVPQNPAQVKAHFSTRRPMLGICLKRYKVNEKGISSRLNTYIDIPLEMSSPHFAAGESLGSDGPVAEHFKLTLQSVVCHRGHSVEAGHYISFVRAGADGVRHERSGSDSTEISRRDSSRDTWLCFDDLAVTQRVRNVDILKALKEESPYLLFYRVQPISDEPPLDNPPPYAESEESFDNLMDMKLAYLPEPSQTRPSFETNIPSSRRNSIEIGNLTEGRGLRSLRGSLNSKTNRLSLAGNFKIGSSPPEAPVIPMTPPEDESKALNNEAPLENNVSPPSSHSNAAISTYDSSLNEAASASNNNVPSIGNSVTNVTVTAIAESNGTQDTTENAGGQDKSPVISSVSAPAATPNNANTAAVLRKPTRRRQNNDGRPGSEYNERRLSASFGKLAAGLKLNRDKGTIPDVVVDEVPAEEKSFEHSTSKATSQEPIKPLSMEAERLVKQQIGAPGGEDSGKSKSKDRRRRLNAMTRGRHRHPDRECIVM